MKKLLYIPLIMMLLLSAVSCGTQQDASEEPSNIKISLEDISSFNVSSVEDNEMMNLVVDYLNSSFEVPEYYFPVDENGLFLLESDNGIFDFSDYYLYGDMNSDGVVDEADVHIMDTAIKESDTDYDLNSDGKTNGKDMTIILERLLKEAQGFSFYDENKKQLDFVDISFDNPHIISSNGLDRVYVAVNDCSGCNQINCSQKTLTLSNPLDFLIKKACAAEYDYEIEKTIDDFFKHMDTPPAKYLLSWSCDVKALKNTSRSNVTVDNVGLLSPYHQLLRAAFKEKVENIHFNPYNMLSETKFAEEDYRWAAYAGMYTSNAMQDTNEIKVDHKYYHYSDFNSHVTNESGITKKFIITYSYSVETLPTMETTSGNVVISGWDDVNGKIRLHRAGPGENQDEIEITAPITSGKFNSSEKIPSGDIIMDFYCEKCGFELNLSEDRAYYAPAGSLDAEVEERVKVVGSIVEESDNEGLSGVEVSLKSSCFEMGNNFTASALTDSNGSYEFLDVPYGIYEVSHKNVKKSVTVNNRNEKEINVDKIEVGGTFDIKVLYRKPEYNMEIKAVWHNANIDLDTARNFGGLYLYTDGSRKLFNNFDSNRNGFIELSEAQNIPFALIDSDADNKVNSREFVQYLDDQGEAGMLMTIEPDEYEVNGSHEYYRVKYNAGDDREAGLIILGIKTSDLDGYVTDNNISYEPDTVSVCWDLVYDLTDPGGNRIADEGASASYLPARAKSNGLMFKSSIPISEFNSLVNNGQAIHINEKVENTISKNVLCEYTLSIKPHK